MAAIQDALHTLRQARLKILLKIIGLCRTLVEILEVLQQLQIHLKNRLFYSIIHKNEIKTEAFVLFVISFI